MSAGIKYVAGSELKGKFQLQRYPLPTSGSASPAMKTFMGIVWINEDVKGLKDKNADNAMIKFASAAAARMGATELISENECSLPAPFETNAAQIKGGFPRGAAHTNDTACSKLGFVNFPSGTNEVDVDITLFNVQFVPETEESAGEAVEVCKVRFFTFSEIISGADGFLPLPADASVSHTHTVYLTADGTVYIALDPCPLGKTFGGGDDVTIGGEARCIQGVEGHILVTSFSSLVTRFGANPLEFLNENERVVKAMIRTSDPEYPQGWIGALNEGCDKNYFQCYKLTNASLEEPVGTKVCDEDDPAGVGKKVKLRWAAGNGTCQSCGPEGGAKLAGIGTKSLIEHGFGENIRVLAATHFATLEDGENEHVAWKRIVMAGDTHLQVGAIPGGSTSVGSKFKNRYVPRNTTHVNVVDIEAMFEVTRNHSWNVYQTWQQTIEVIGDYDFDEETYKNVSINGLDLSMKKLFLQSAMTTSAHASISAQINENFKVGFDMTTTIAEDGTPADINASAYMSMGQILDAMSLIDQEGTAEKDKWKDKLTVKYTLGGEVFERGTDQLSTSGKTFDEAKVLVGNDKLYVKEVNVNYKLHIPNGLGMGGAMTYTVDAGISPEGINPSLNFHWQKTDALSFKADFDASGITALGVNYNPVLIGTSKKDRILGATVKELRLNSGLVWKPSTEASKESFQPNMMLKYNFGDMVSIDADLLTGVAKFNLKKQLIDINKVDKDGNTDFSMSLAAWLEADTVSDNGIFTAGVDFRMEKALTKHHRVFGRVVAFAEAGVTIGVGGGPTSTAITSTGFRFFAGGRVGLEWRNNIFEYLGFPFNINFAPSLGFAIDLSYGTCSSYGTCAGYSAGAAFAVNLGITAFRFEWVDGLRAELTRKHNSVFKYIPFLGPILARLPIIKILGPKENVHEYINRAGPHRAVNVFQGCAKTWEKSLIEYRNTVTYQNAPNTCGTNAGACKKDLLENWHLANPFCDNVTRCFDDRRVRGYENSWMREYFPLDCTSAGSCNARANPGDVDDQFTHSDMMQNLAKTEQIVYDKLIVGETVELESHSLMNTLKKWSGWNMVKGFIVGLFTDPAVKDCKVSPGKLNEECFKAYKRYIDFINGYAASDAGHTCWDSSPSSGGGGCDPSVGPFGRPWVNAKVTDFIGRAALWSMEDNLKDSNVGKDHTQYRFVKHGTATNPIECGFCIRKLWHMYLQSMRCANNPDILKAQSLFDPRYMAFVGTSDVAGQCKPEDPAENPLLQETYENMKDGTSGIADSAVANHSADKARVYGMRSLQTDVKSTVMDLIANPALRSPVWSTASTWNAVSAGENAITINTTLSNNSQISGAWGLSGANVTIPMYANMSEIHADLQRLVCWSNSSAGGQDISPRKLTGRYYAARRLVTYVKVLAEQGVAIGLDDIQVKALGEAMAWANTGMTYLRQALHAVYQQIDPECDSSYDNDLRCADSLDRGGRGFIVRDSGGANAKVEGSPKADRLAAVYSAKAPIYGLPANTGAVTYRDVNALVLKITFGIIPLSFVFYGKFDGDTSITDAALLTRLSTKDKTHDPAWTVSAANQAIKDKWAKECHIITGSDRKSSRCKKYRKNGNRVPVDKLEEAKETTCFPHGRKGSGSSYMLGMTGCCDSSQQGWINFWCDTSSIAYAKYRYGACGWQTCEWKDMNTTGWPRPSDSPAWPGPPNPNDCAV